jgi:hypothetical protein
MWWSGVSAVVLLGACDPLSFLDQPGSQQKAAARATRTRAWTCQKVLSPSVLLLEEQGRAVTVALEHVTVISPLARQRAMPETAHLTAPQIHMLYTNAWTVTTQLLGNAAVTLDPLPGYTDKRIIAQVLTFSQLDVGERLLDAGLAVITVNSARPMPSTYYAAQQRAMQREVGVWAVGIEFPKRFQMVTRGKLVDADAPAAPVAMAQTQHDPAATSNAVDAPVEGAELIARANLRAMILCNLAVRGAPKKYTLVLAWRARLLQNELSGPLETFRPAKDAWNNLTLSVCGGLHTNIMLTTAAHELICVTRATRQVYTGEIISGYDLRLQADDQEVGSNDVAFSSNATLEKLE